jgi:hypothetical protein
MDRGITVTPPSVRVRLTPGSSKTVKVAVTRSVDAPATSSVEAVARYRTRKGGVTRTKTSVAVLAVTTPALPPAQPGPIAVTPAVGTAQLIEYQSTDVFFTLTNRSDRPQKIDGVQLSFPQSLAVQFHPAKGTVKNGKTGKSANPKARNGKDGNLNIGALGTLTPGDTAVIHLTLTTAGAVQPGDAVIVLAVHATDGVDGSTSTAVSAQKISLSVLGESSVLQVLGVPSLLLVPGIVLAVVLWALWTHVYPRRAFTLTPDSGLEGKVVMWVFALLPSLALPFIYPTITSWFGPARDYRKSYGLDDILYVWIIAALAAFVIWALGILVRWACLRFFIAQEHDDPRRLLAKFARRLWNRNRQRRSAMYKDEERVIIVGGSADRPLVAPAIEYSSSSLTDAERAKLQGYTDLFRLSWFFWRKKARLTIAYEPQDPLNEPTIVDKSDLKDFSEDALVRASS